MKGKQMVARYCRGFTLTLGAVFVCMGLVLLLQFASMYDFIIQEALAVGNGTKAYEAWRTNDPPLTMDIYFFNWTNAADVLDRTKKPHFAQVGPYRFREVKEKYDIRFHDNDTVSYKYVKKYYYMGEESPCKLTDVINTINMVAVSAAYKKRFARGMHRFSVGLILNTMSSVYVTKSVDELLFTGYYDPMLGLLRTVSPFLSKESQINDHYFGWFYKRNATYGLSGEFSMSTSRDENFGVMMSWNHSNKTRFFGGRCNEIRGSAGEFHPLNRRRDAIWLFSSELCSSQKLEYERDEEIKGIKAFKYSANSLFDNGSRFPETSCFCQGDCLPTGVLNMSTCRNGAPVFLSLPHFYNADPYFTEVIDGLTPNKGQHDFFITLEPKSAIAVEVAARMQINVLLQPFEQYALFRDVPRILVPVFYFDQVVLTTDELAEDILLVQNLPEIVSFASYVFIAIGIALMTSMLIAIWLCPGRSSEEVKLKQADERTQVGVPLTFKGGH